MIFTCILKSFKNEHSKINKIMKLLVKKNNKSIHR